MLTMYDAITVSNIPTGALYVAGYVNGNWPTYSQLQKLFPKAVILSIAVTSSADAECLDVENGDATVADVVAWLKRQFTRNVYRPVIYSSVANMSNVISVIEAAGISLSSVRLWSAHYDQGNHICGPSSCGQSRQLVDGTQWTDKANGLSLDESTLNNTFFTQSTGTTMPATSLSMPYTLQNGSSDTGQTVSYVTRAQAILLHVFNQKITVDGQFGSATETAVKNIQSSLGLTSDGVVGPVTWKILING